MPSLVFSPYFSEKIYLTDGLSTKILVYIMDQPQKPDYADEKRTPANSGRFRMGAVHEPSASEPSLRNQITENVETSIQQTRRRRFVRMWILPVLLAVLFILLVILGHDLFVKNEYMRFMESISREITKYSNANNHLPSRQTFLRFDIKSRNLNITSVQYEDYLILVDSPPQTVLAYSPLTNFRFLANGHVVIYLDGTLAWVRPKTLQLQLQQREVFYNSRMIP